MILYVFKTTVAIWWPWCLEREGNSNRMVALVSITAECMANVFSPLDFLCFWKEFLVFVLSRLSKWLYLLACRWTHSWLLEHWIVCKWSSCLSTPAKRISSYHMHSNVKGGSWRECRRVTEVHGVKALSPYLWPLQYLLAQLCLLVPQPFHLHLPILLWNISICFNANVSTFSIPDWILKNVSVKD